jgi:hypothetical protein
MADESPPNEPQLPPADDQSGAITAELVREVADRVYALLLRDLRLEAERSRSSPALSRRDPNR